MQLHTQNCSTVRSLLSIKLRKIFTLLSKRTDEQLNSFFME